MRKVVTTSYHCSCHDNPYKTSSKAYACERRSGIEKKKQRKLDLINNEVRLRLEDPADIWEALKAFVLKYYGWKILYTETKKFDFTNVEELYCSHDAPIGKPRSTWKDEEDKKTGIQTYWPGWKFWVKGTIEGPKFNYLPYCKNQEPQFTALTSGSFSDGPYRVRGCNSGSFNGGPTFSGEFRMYIEDFPKIKEKYEAYIKERDELKYAAEVEKRLLAKCF